MEGGVAIRGLGPSNITLVAHSHIGVLIWPRVLERLPTDPEMLCARVRTPSMARYSGKNKHTFSVH